MVRRAAVRLAMGIVGNLNDLTLVEFLQTIALARKSGVLEIRGAEGLAWLAVREGAVVRVALSGRDLSRGTVLAGAGLDEQSPAEALESCLWDAALGELLGLLAWKEGEFTFDACSDPEASWPGPAGLALPSSLSPEFLALEGARREDHQGFAAGLGAPAAQPLAALIAVDPDLRLLEALKQALHAQARSVHIFQHPEDALRRLKQYLQSGTVPTLLIGEDSVAEENEMGAGWHTLAAGARRMAPSVRIILLGRAGRERGPADQVIERCTPRHDNQAAFAAFLKRVAVALGAAA